MLISVFYKHSFTVSVYNAACDVRPAYAYVLLHVLTQHKALLFSYKIYLLLLQLIEMTLAVICVILKGFGVATALENTHIYHGQDLEEFFSNVPTIPGLTVMQA